MKDTPANDLLTGAKNKHQNTNNIYNMSKVAYSKHIQTKYHNRVRNEKVIIPFVSIALTNLYAKYFDK
jgi:hypothetical protein